MSLTKNRLIESIHNAVGLTRSQSVKSVETILETIKKTLESDEDVLISGFGKLSVKENSQRKCRSKTNENVYMPEAKKVVTFRCSPVLIEKINGKRK